MNTWVKTLPASLNRLLLMSGAFIALVSSSLADTNTYIRIKNLSDFDFQDIVVARKKYENLKRGATSSYQAFEQGAYRYADVQLRAGTNLVKLRPFCYVGASPIGAGKFTYGLTVWTNYHPNLKIRKDTNAPPGTEVKGFGLRSSYKGRHPKTRVSNGSGVGFSEVQLAGRAIGQVESGKTSSYFNLEIGPYMPDEVVVTFGQILPGGGRPGSWEETHMKFFHPNSEEQNKRIYDGWFTYVLNIESNLCLNIAFARD